MVPHNDPAKQPAHVAPVLAGFEIPTPHGPALASSLLGLTRPTENMVTVPTDGPPRKPALLAAFLESDRTITLDIPRDNRLEAAAKLIESSLVGEATKSIRLACALFLNIAADFYQVGRPDVRVLAARPIRSREGGWATELFGDYDPETKLIRVWMRTAMRKQITSFGTFFSTVCHEFCHHLDYQRFRYGESWHTRGFYERTAALYHHARGTPAKRLVWLRMSGRRWRIDWARTNRGS